MRSLLALMKVQKMNVISWIVIAMTFTVLDMDFAHAEFAPSCPKMSKANSCDFYDKCLEAKNSCGSDGYPLGYGLKFCETFNSMELSASGEKWITATMACLQERLIDYAEVKTSCDKIHTEAFNNHVQCYVDSGFCKLPLSDKAQIAATNLWATVTSLEGTVQAAKTLSACAK